MCAAAAAQNMVFFAPWRTRHTAKKHHVKK
jgi:hypothetical protein